jgi:hypothetical protein
MKVALTEQFLEDNSRLSAALERKCRELLSSLRKIEAGDLHEKARPGWRLHRLKSSPFVSLSLDMNYRLLCKIEGETVYLHRVVKHDLADMARVNRNDGSAPAYYLDGAQLKPANLHDALVALGVSPDTAAPFRGVGTEEELLDALQRTDEKTASTALVLYETSGVVIPRTKFTMLQHDKELEAILAGAQADWHVYLHPSQRYVAGLPVDARLLVTGSAGTGKTVCAWYRMQHLATQGHTVGFACSNNHILAVSKERLTSLLQGAPGEAYFLVPSSADELAQLCAAVDHLVIDEGQEFATTWYHALGKCLGPRQTGLTLFHDVNQLGGNYQPGDSKRYEHRLSTWDAAMRAIPGATSIELYINYRNSREIAEYYFGVLSDALPKPLKCEVPVFGSGEVIAHRTSDANQVPVLVADIINKLRSDYTPSEIAVVYLGGGPGPHVLARSLADFGVPAGTELGGKEEVVVTVPKEIRGHERKAVIVCTPPRGAGTDKLGKAINSYIALSRARDRLVVIEIGR